MKIIHTIEQLRQWRNSVSGSIAFVPTMGNLHDGHMHLVKEAQKKADYVVVSIFVNRLQFGVNEDFDCYPRTLQNDIEKLTKEDTAVLFVPDESELYPSTQNYYIALPSIENELCGMFREGHFKGVATIVMKLLNIVQPHIACFGKKDYQQLAIIKGMIHDFNVPVRILGVPTVRASDGLALSSRNQYLTSLERKKAPELYAALQNIAHDLQSGRKDFLQQEQDAIKKLHHTGWIVDYISIRQIDNLLPPHEQDKELVILAAAKLGSTRLIDNLEVML